ncbi:MAG: hypothetical protein GY946_15810 [bacterium]|nr:hypothetical protein [bacterium]
MGSQASTDPGTSSAGGVGGRVAFLASLLFGGVMLFAAFGKLIDPVAFEEIISAKGLDILLPAWIWVYVVVAAQVLIGTALVLGIRKWHVLIPAALLLGVFIFLSTRHYLQWLDGSEEDLGGCGCFGALLTRTPREAFWQDLMLVPLLGLACLFRPTGRLVVRHAVTALVGVAAVVLTLLSPNLPLDDFATKLRVGTPIKEICVGQGKETSACLHEIVEEEGAGEHLIVIGDIYDATLHPALNEYALGEFEPYVTFIDDLTKAELDDLDYGELAPSFEVFPAPKALLRALYRRLPRSFLVRDGVVVEIFDGLPPLGRWKTK